MRSYLVSSSSMISSSLRSHSVCFFDNGCVYALYFGVTLMFSIIIVYKGCDLNEQKGKN